MKTFAERNKLTQRQSEIEAMLITGGTNYSEKMAKSDLERITNGEYKLNGYTGKYTIEYHGKAILFQKSSLRIFIIDALGLYLD
jgi:hypothetical protein